MKKKIKVILGLSGGADSVALLHMLSRREDVILLAAHMNFQLRGDDSFSDEYFVRDLIQSRFPQIPLFVKRVEAVSYAKERSISIEMAARDLRYKWFQELLETNGADRIAVAHHSGDQVETILMHVIRGSGGQGLLGMKERNGIIWRPLLGLTKEEILSYIDSQGLTYVEDKSNYDLSFQRNLVRHQLIPLIKKLNPNFSSTLLRNREAWAEEQACLLDAILDFQETSFDEKTQSYSLEIPSKHLPFYLYRLLQEKGISKQQVHDILASDTGARFKARNGEVLEKFRGRLFVCPPLQPTLKAQEVLFSQSPKCLLPGIGELIVSDKGTIHLPLFYFNHPILLRTANAKDTFKPYGMTKGKKQLFEYLKERGIPSFYRPCCPLFEDPNRGIVNLVLSSNGTPPTKENLFSLHLQPSTPLGHLLARSLEEKTI